MKVILVFLGLVALACSSKETDEVVSLLNDAKPFNINDIIANLIVRLIEALTEIISALIEYILQLILGGRSEFAIKYSIEVRDELKKYQKSFTSWLLDFLVGLYEDLMQLIQDGISISSQLIDSLLQAIDMLIHGEMPPLDILHGLLIEILGILGRRRRDVESSVITYDVAGQFYDGVMQKADTLLLKSPLYQQMTVEQQAKATRVVKWALDQVMAARL